jgi:membrane associated rhomboid family serine protease
MIPFRDNIPSLRFPICTVTIIAANVIVFLYELYLPGPALEGFVSRFGVVPSRFLDSSAGLTTLLFVSTVPFISSMFIHAGFLHLLGNMWYLWIFGDNIEDRLGRGRFLLFYLSCGVIASLIHLAFNFGSDLPSVGASGAIAGILGAYLVTFPHARILTLIPIFIFWQIIELPAILVLGFWFLIQLLSGTAAIAVFSQSGGGVAWWAHVGGFVAGMLLIKRMQRRRFISYM